MTEENLGHCETEADVKKAIRKHLPVLQQSTLKTARNPAKNLMFFFREYGENNPIAFSLSRRGSVIGNDNTKPTPMNGNVFIVHTKTDGSFRSCTIQDVEILIAGRPIFADPVPVSQEKHMEDSAAASTAAKAAVETPVEIPVTSTTTLEEKEEKVETPVEMPPNSTTALAAAAEEIPSALAEEVAPIAGPEAPIQDRQEYNHTPAALAAVVEEPIISPSILRRVFGSDAVQEEQQESEPKERKILDFPVSAPVEMDISLGDAPHEARPIETKGPQPVGCGPVEPVGDSDSTKNGKEPVTKKHKAKKEPVARKKRVAAENAPPPRRSARLQSLQQEQPPKRKK